MNAHGPELEALSWDLASRLASRYPDRLRVMRLFPGGGQYDCLALAEPDGPLIWLNRLGTIQVDHPADEPWRPMTWDTYAFGSRPKIADALAVAAGLRAPIGAPTATAESLTYRVLAALARAAATVNRPIDIQMGFLDSSGSTGSAPNPLLSAFGGDWSGPGSDRPLFGDPGYELWIVESAARQMMLLDQRRGRAWAPGAGQPIPFLKDGRWFAPGGAEGAALALWLWAADGASS